MPISSDFSIGVLLALLGITLCALILSIVLSFLLLRSGGLKLGRHILLTLSYTLTICALGCTLFYGLCRSPEQPSVSGSSTIAPPVTTAPESEATTPPEPTQPEPTEPPTEPAPTLGTVQMTDKSDPDNWDVSWEIFLEDQLISGYERENGIFFSNPNLDGYFSLPGISTFRGDNYRTGAAYGTVNVSQELLTDVWNREISSLKKGTGSGSWSGSGWTGQPLIVQWDAETRQLMNLYPDKKAKDDLVEVIYATLDGHIYFYDLEDGSYTRDPMNVGMAFKGAGTLDPRGYPLMYVGAGDKTSGGKIPRMFVISLIDCTILYEYGNDETLRNRKWIAFDSAPLVDAATDTLIWPGESGVLYTIHLNTHFDRESGSVSVDPDEIVKTRYNTSLDRTLGYEASSIIVENNLYIADNGGMLFCIDLNTMELIWAQNTRDDNNATPIFEWGEDGRGYLYGATSMEYSNGTVYLYKIDAATGEYIWEVKYDNVYFDKSVSGGVLSSPVLGKKGTQLEGMLIHTIAKTPGAYNGLLVALDSATGQIIWEVSLNQYCWSSPVAVYSDSGEAHLILCDSGGNVMLIDPLNGTVLSQINIGTNIEASPAIFNDMLVVGTRGMLVYGIKIS